MKALLSFILILSLITLSCEKSSEPTIENNNELTYGNYTGFYKLIWNYGTANEDSIICDTELTLDENGYRLKEIQNTCPPQSAGIFDKDLQTITFYDSIVHTANFDWTLIINGSYSYEFDGINLEMVQIDSQQKRKYIYKLSKSN